MCGRYTITAEWEELVLRFMLDDRPGKYQPRYNVAPGQYIPAIIGGRSEQQRPEGGGRTLTAAGTAGAAAKPGTAASTPAAEPGAAAAMPGAKPGMAASTPAAAGMAGNRFGELRWGLVPNWARDDRSGYRMLNARSETAADKPAFRQLLARKRCLIPADGFYEWKREAANKQPYRFIRKDGGLFGMAALYDTWITPDGGKLHTCTILTTSANALIAPIHDRMPVILSRSAEQIWLDRSIQGAEELCSLLVPYPAEEMACYAVTPKVGNVRYEQQDCIEPLA